MLNFHKRHKLILAIILSAFSLSLYSVNAQSDPVVVECGTRLQGELTESNNNDFYTINLAPGDRITISVDALGENVTIAHRFSDPSGSFLWNWNGGLAETTLGVGATGDYTIEVLPYSGIGVYRLNIGCVLENGTVIEPGELLPNAPTTIPEFSGFGFPTIPSVDFSNGIEVALLSGDSLVTPIAGDLIVLYAYETMANSTATLNISRVNGDISIGVAVIHKDTNQIIFLGGMPFTDTLSLGLTFPADGTYIIGIFQLPTQKKLESSGAVEISIE